MKEIIIKTQAELNALPEKFEEYTRIYIQNDHLAGRVYVRRRWENSSVVARENSSVVAWGNSSVEARENSSVVARENSSVVAWGNSSVVAWGNSSVEAWGNSSVVAWGNSSVEARENSSVVAWGNSSVVAWENSSVVAWGNSSVVAWENSSVVARGNSAIRLASISAAVVLNMFAACWVLAEGKIQKEAETVTIIRPTSIDSTDAWLNSQGTKQDGGTVILFKRVSSDLKTQENTANETLWAVGSVIDHPSWSPSEDECGNGKFHACSRPYFCDEFRFNQGDRYIAIRVKVEDLYVWTKNPSYPYKVAFKKGTVLYECDKMGKKIGG